MSKLDPVLLEYVDIKKQIADLEAKLESLKEQVIEVIEYNLEGRTEYITPLGTFKISGRNTWKYSPAISELQKALLTAKKEEEHNGQAELMKASQFPVFIPTKEKVNG